MLVTLLTTLIFSLDESCATSESDVKDPLDSFDCPMRQFALEYAMKIQPFLSRDQLQDIADGLNGAAESVNNNCVIVPSDWSITKNENRVKSKVSNSTKSNDNATDTIPTIYVDYINGNDNNNGLTLDKPIKHLETAITVARKLNLKNNINNNINNQNINSNDYIFKRIVLRKGKHYLPNSIFLTLVDSNLLITNYNNEKVTLSGAIKLECDNNEWKNYSNDWKMFNNTDNIYNGALPASNSTDGNIIYIGQFNNYNDCFNKIKTIYKEYGFGTFTYHNSGAGDYAYMCYGRVGSTLDGPYQDTTTVGALQNIKSCDLNSFFNQKEYQNISTINGLRVNGIRAVRARYPNGNSERYPCGFCSSIKGIQNMCT